MPHILAPGAFAHYPLADRIAPIKIPVSFLYGSNDWMDVQGGHSACEHLREAGNTDTGVRIIERAGHHLYLDNPDAANEALLDIIQNGHA